jgi:hypothetical protein
MYSRALRLEPNDNLGGEPKVILRTASELRQQVVSLNYAPSELAGDLGIYAASERHRKGRISETRGECAPFATRYFTPSSPRGETRGTGQEAGAGMETRAGEAQGHRLADYIGFREGKGYPPFCSWSVCFDR